MFPSTAELRQCDVYTRFCLRAQIPSTVFEWPAGPAAVFSGVVILILKVWRDITASVTQSSTTVPQLSRLVLFL